MVVTIFKIKHEYWTSGPCGQRPQKGVGHALPYSQIDFILEDGMDFVNILSFLLFKDFYRKHERVTS